VGRADAGLANHHIGFCSGKVVREIGTNYKKIKIKQGKA
jgi:hypothetical protein